MINRVQIGAEPGPCVRGASLETSRTDTGGSVAVLGGEREANRPHEERAAARIVTARRKTLRPENGFSHRNPRHRRRAEGGAGRRSLWEPIGVSV
ncbi:hypothetical protein MHYP_G00273600 [Metynnis hypsauchen]